MAPNGARSFFLLIQTLLTFWATWIFILRFLFLICVGSKISRFAGPRFPNFQKSGLGLGQPCAGLGQGRASCAIDVNLILSGWKAWDAFLLLFYVCSTGEKQDAATVFSRYLEALAAVRLDGFCM